MIGENPQRDVIHAFSVLGGLILFMLYQCFFYGQGIVVKTVRIGSVIWLLDICSGEPGNVLVLLFGTLLILFRPVTFCCFTSKFICIFLCQS